MNHYPRHIGDWMRDTAHLSEVEECIYSRMIDMYYSREKPLPVDATSVCRLVRATSKEARCAVGTMLAEFFVLEDDGWHQKRCDAELSKYAEKSAKASASAQAMWSKRNANAMRTHMRTQSDGNANQEPIANNQEPVEPKPRATRSALPDWMPAEVWQKWSKHRGNKLTPQAVSLQIGKLETLRAAGHDPAQMIDLAIESGWATFYPPRGGAPPMTAKQDARAKTAAQIFGAKDERNDERVIDGEAQRVA